MRILIVDDERSLRLTLAANLELEGFDVAQAQSGEQALDLIGKQEFDLVLSDIRMPGIHGVDLFRHIKRLRPGLPVVLMSAFALEQLVEQAIHEGVFTVLVKPFEVEQLVTVLVKAFRGQIVLIVDDKEQDATATAAALRGAGVKAQAVMGARDAIDVVSGGTADVCVVDLVLTDGTGPEVVSKILELDPSIAVIAVSGNSNDALLRKAAGTGVYACMQKPVDLRDLMHAIAKARARVQP